MVVVVMLVKMVTVFNAAVLVASPMGVMVTIMVKAMAIAMVLRVLVVAIVLCVVWGARG